MVDLQLFAYEAAQQLAADLKEAQDKGTRARVATAISNLAKAWTALEDSKREIRGRPKAGVRKYEAERAVGRRRRRQAVAAEAKAAAEESEVGFRERPIPGMPVEWGGLE